ncbi:MAG: GAF domain-containing protein, partial [Anaerolineae bacterium]
MALLGEEGNGSLAPLAELRQWLAELEMPEAERKRAEGALTRLEQLSEESAAQRRMAMRRTTLYRVLRAVAGQTDPDYVARAAVEAIIKEAGWPNVVVAVPDETKSHWVVRAAGGALSSTSRWRRPIYEGVVGRAFKTGETQLVPDVRADPDYIAGTEEIRSELAVPINRGGRTLGVLNLESDAPDAFDSDDVGLVESLADAVALALDTAHLYSQAHQNAVNLSALYVVTRVASQSLVLEEVLSQVLSSALTLLGFEAGLVGLTDPAEGQLRLAAKQGLPPSLAER